MANKPLIYGTILNFQINFTVPSDFVAGWGSGIITDDLAKIGLAFNSAGTNTVKVNGTALVDGYSISANAGIVTIQIDNNKLVASDTVEITISTTINDITKVTIGTNTNTASLKFNDSHEGDASTAYTVDSVTASITNTDAATRYIANIQGRQIALNASFTSVEYTEPVYNYVVTTGIIADYFTIVAAVYQGSTKKADATIDTTTDKKYTLTFASSSIDVSTAYTIVITATVKNGAASGTLSDVFSLAIAGNTATSSESTNIVLVAPITVTKTLL